MDERITTQYLPDGGVYQDKIIKGPGFTQEIITTEPGPSPPSGNIMGISNFPATGANITICIVLFVVVITVIVLFILFVSFSNQTNEGFAKSKLYKKMKKYQEQDDVHYDYVMIKNGSKFNFWYKDAQPGEQQWKSGTTNLFRVDPKNPKVGVYNVPGEFIKNSTPLMKIKIERRDRKLENADPITKDFHNKPMSRKHWMISVQESKLRQNNITCSVPIKLKRPILECKPPQIPGSS